jgi:UDP-N-acetyl-D-glucosamine dehydrogenase
MKGSRVLILGLAYKANVDDDRESPSYKLIQKFEALGARVEYHDPFVPVIPRTREHAEFAGRKSVSAITPDYDLIVLATGHTAYREFDFSRFPMPLVDTRNSVTRRPAKYFRA